MGSRQDFQWANGINYVTNHFKRGPSSLLINIHKYRTIRNTVERYQMIKFRAYGVSRNT